MANQSFQEQNRCLSSRKPNYYRRGVIQKLNDLIFKKWRQIFFEKNPKTQRFEKTQRFDIRDPDYHRIQLLMLKVNSSSPFYGGPDKLSAPRII